MRIAIVGAGALGSFVGGRLAQAKMTVSLIDSNRERVEAINRDGLRIESDVATTTIAIPAFLASDAEGIYDALIVLTKGVHTDAAIASCIHLIGPQTLVLTFQNGLGNSEVLARHVGANRVAIGMTNWAVDLKSDASVASVGSGGIRIWHGDGHDDPRVQRLASTLNGAGLNCLADTNTLSAIWEKVAFNAAINSVSAITSRTVGEIGDDSDARALVSDIAREVLRVATKKGIAVSIAKVESMVAEAFRSHRSHKPSMLQDVIAGRQTEIEAINGAVVEEAERIGVKAPVTEALLRLVRMHDRRMTASPSYGSRESHNE
ncbi:ketopantoate reductase family protein [Tardiphaga sp. 71_E8_N1_1]|uniref:ketopantoate reductase family protein n=1 Tax=Tardiphaga sp. 71_E8_N1_1 TaxID=3240784 RepID=UPI003F8BAA74